MKTLLAAVALATLVASPTFAQDFAKTNADSAMSAHRRGEAVTHKSDQVIDLAGHVETDPDVNIRSQLVREGQAY
ncbi:MAG: hypothetical protein QOF09_2198 [Alphaproteobacteria bacterium]|jgi:uncharacterized protein YdeI (BOF family)|nr:hypothetical protein [Alphaproteobacteria bacterium]